MDAEIAAEYERSKNRGPDAEVYGEGKAGIIWPMDDFSWAVEALQVHEHKARAMRLADADNLVRCAGLADDATELYERVDEWLARKSVDDPRMSDAVDELERTLAELRHGNMDAAEDAALAFLVFADGLRQNGMGPLAGKVDEMADRLLKERGMPVAARLAMRQKAALWRRAG
jgi:hypothetical protein